MFKIHRQNHSSKTGFTLVEMLVSIAVFMSVMVIAVSSLITIIDSNKKAQSIKSIVDNVTFAVDSMSRDLRVGTSYSCWSNDTSSFVGDCLGAGGTLIRYKKADGTFTEFRYTNTPDVGMGNIQKLDCTSGGCGTDWKSMTAPTNIVNITNMKFYITGTTPGNQPRIIITVEGIVNTGNSSVATKFNLQTSVSQRSRLSI